MGQSQQAPDQIVASPLPDRAGTFRLFGPRCRRLHLRKSRFAVGERTHGRRRPGIRHGEGPTHLAPERPH